MIVVLFYLSEKGWAILHIAKAKSCSCKLAVTTYKIFRNIARTIIGRTKC